MPKSIGQVVEASRRKSGTCHAVVVDDDMLQRLSICCAPSSPPQFCHTRCGRAVVDVPLDSLVPDGGKHGMCYGDGISAISFVGRRNMIYSPSHLS